MFVQCRGCNQTVPGSMAHCQFCGASLAGLVAPTKASIWHDDANSYQQPYKRPSWIPLAYNLVAGYLAVSGLIQIIPALVQMSKGKEPSFFVIAGGIINIILGIGLIARIEFIRGVVNFVCGINLLLGVFWFLALVPITLILGWIGLLLLFLHVLGMASNVAMIYLVGETD